MNIKKSRNLFNKKNKKLNIKLGFACIIITILINYINQYTNEHKTLSSDGNVQFSECVDGDTAKFIVNGKKETVRFLAIDTPETVKPNTPIQPFGKEASEYTCKSLKLASSINLEYEDGNKTDKYNRLLAWVFVDDKLLQEDLINNGFAKVDYIYGNYKYTDRLYKAQDNAKNNHLGIWE